MCAFVHQLVHVCVCICGDPSWHPVGEVPARVATMIDIRCGDVIDMGVRQCSVC